VKHIQTLTFTLPVDKTSFLSSTYVYSFNNRHVCSTRDMFFFF